MFKIFVKSNIKKSEVRPKNNPIRVLATGNKWRTSPKEKEYKTRMGAENRLEMINKKPEIKKLRGYVLGKGKIIKFSVRKVR